MMPGSVAPIALIDGVKADRWGRPLPVIVVTASIVSAMHTVAEQQRRPDPLKPCAPGTILSAVRAVLPL